MISKEVTINGKYPLSGTLTLPTSKEMNLPAVLIISGSGKGDRDGNIKNVKLNIYKELAEILTMNGFITLRYDKRGTYKSSGNYFETGLYDLIDDAVDAVHFLRTVQQVDHDKIFILGHSEGALLAPVVSQKTNISGLILLAGAARPSREISQMQIDRVSEEMKNTKGIKGSVIRLLKVPEKLKKQNQKTLEKIKNSDRAVMLIKGMRMNAKWIRETLEYDIRKYLSEVTCPVLVVSGGKDVQVPPEDAHKIAEFVRGEVEWHVIEDMNHILRKYDGIHTMLRLIKEYKWMSHQPIHEELREIMISWIKKHVEVQ